MFLGLLRHCIHFAAILGGWPHVLRTLGHPVLRRLVGTPTIVVLLIQLAIIKTISHIEGILSIIVDHTFSVSFARLAKLVLIVSAMSTRLNHLLFYVLISSACLCLRLLWNEHGLHEVVILGGHYVLGSSGWVAHVLIILSMCIILT